MVLRSASRHWVWSAYGDESRTALKAIRLGDGHAGCELRWRGAWLWELVDATMTSFGVTHLRPLLLISSAGALPIASADMKACAAACSRDAFE